MRGRLVDLAASPSCCIIGQRGETPMWMPQQAEAWQGSHVETKETRPLAETAQHTVVTRTGRGSHGGADNAHARDWASVSGDLRSDERSIEG